MKIKEIVKTYKNLINTWNYLKVEGIMEFNGYYQVPDENNKGQLYRVKSIESSAKDTVENLIFLRIIKYVNQD